MRYILCILCSTLLFAEGYPNLIINAKQIETIREKIKTEPHASTWKKIIATGKQYRAHKVQPLQAVHRWERAFAYAVDGKTYIVDIRSHLLARANGPKPIVKHYDWALADDAVLYDMIGNSFSEEEHTKIRAYLSAKVQATIVFTKTYGGTHNMMSLQRWNAALLAYAAQDKVAIKWALESKYGFKHSINSLRDGIWDEANGYAIFYVLPGLIAVAEAAKNFDGTDLWAYKSPSGDSLKTFVDRYLDMSWPLEQTGVGKGSLRFASYGDGATNYPTATEPGDIYLANIPALDERNTRSSLQAALEVAYSRSKDPAYAWILSLNPKRNNSHERSYLNYTGLTHGLVLPKNPKPPVAKSSVWPKAGIAMLRADESSNYWSKGSPSAFMLMNAWYGHGHQDRLSLLFHANGRLLYPDYNLVQYEPPVLGWTRHAIGHNLVLVDRLGPWGGPQTIRHEFTPAVKFIAVTADPTEQVNKSMKKLDVWETRSYFLTKDYLLDFFWIQSKIDKEREFTWVLHGIGQLSSIDMPYFVKPKAPVLNHFKWIRDERHWFTDSNWRVSWTQQGAGIEPGVLSLTDAWFKAKPVGVSMTMLAQKGTEAHIGKGPLSGDPRYGFNALNPEGTMPIA
ncbi:MAG: heparinase II/III-family protein, partial [Lentisphaeria bacterium]|nr:heparinase II/III-family protein [Lentisphaeria bacterium]